MSNVSPTTQMMELIEASRAYEANVRMIQNQDQLLGTLVTRVLRPV
jgi:flagellar basal body rod protein FlgG